MCDVPVAVLLTDQQQRWLRGDRALVESYIVRHPSLQTHREGLLDLIYHEVLLREERGEEVHIGDYQQRFPELTDDLQLLFEVHQGLSQETVLEAVPVPKPRRRLPRIPGYRLLSRLGSGGVGVVYKARQLGLGRLVAIKLLQSGSAATPADRARFRREAEAVARLNHPHVVQIYDVGERAACPFLILEYADAGSLDRRLTTQLPSPETAARLMLILARTLQEIHQRGIVHCDLKPANILLSRTTDVQGLAWTTGLDQTELFDVKVTDFGFARRLDAEHRSLSGQALGTLHYMAPEQVAGHSHEIGPAADIHALGAILFELLTGRPPFLGADLPQVLLQVRFHEPVFPRAIQSTVPGDLETICLKCLSKVPQQRYISAAALAEDLDRYLAGRPILARPVGTLERCWRWSRRNRSLAAALFAAVVFLVLGTTISTVFALVADNARVGERTARLSAEESSRRLAQSLYFDRIARASLERQNGNIVRARELLNLCRPEPDQPDLRSWEWNFLHRCCHQERLVLQSPLKGLVHRVAYNPAGDLLAAGDEIGNVAVWRASDGVLVHIFREHRSAIFHLAFSTDGKWLSSGERDGTVIIRNANDGSERIRIQIADGSALKGTVFSPLSFDLALDVQGDRLVAAVWKPFAIEDGVELATWNLATQQRLNSRQIAAAEFVVLNPRGDTVAVRYKDGRTQLQALDSNREVAPLSDSAEMSQLLFSPDGRFLLGTSGSTHKVWDVATGAVLNASSDHSAPRSHCALSNDGRTALSLLPGGRELCVWDTSSGKELGRFLGHVGAVHNAVLRPQSAEFASAGGLIQETGDVRVWPFANGRHPQEWQQHAGLLRSVAVSPDGSEVASSGDVPPFRRSAVATHDSLEDRPGTTWGVAYSADGRWRAAATGGVGEESAVVDLFDIAQQSSVRQLQIDGTNFRTVALTDKLLVAGSNGGTVALWNLPDGQQRSVLTVGGLGQTVSGLALSPHGQLIATACEAHIGTTPSEIQVRTLSDGALQFRFTAHVGTSPVLAFHPTGKFLVSGGGFSDRTVRIWDMNDGHEIRVLRAHSKGLCGIAISSDGDRIFTASTDGTIKLWHGVSGTEILSLTAPQGDLAGITLSDNGQILVGGSRRGEVFLWDGSPLIHE